MKYFILILSFRFYFTLSLSAQGIDNSKPHVYFFLLEECVICQSYSQKINEIVSKYDTNFVFIAVFPSFISKKETIQKFLLDYKIDIPYKTDYFKQLTKKFGVTVTPEVVIFQPDTNTLLYRGRIDNEFVSLGRRRRNSISDDLVNAMDQVISGKNPDPSITPSVGCLINLDEMDK